MTKLLDTVQLDLLQRFALNELNELETEQIKLLLRRFISGELDDLESQQVMDMLGEHEHCMDMLDALWMEQPIGQALASTPPLSEERSTRMQERLSRQIQRSNATGAAFKLGITGFSAVTSGLLRPFMKRNSWQTRRDRRRKKND